MKKNILLIIITLLLLPLGVKAATSPVVLTLTANSNNLKINYSGTIDTTSLAVMCKLYDSNDTEIDLLSSPVDSGNFEGSFTVASAGDYAIACANYSGGSIKKTNVTVAAPVTYSITFNPNGGKVIDYDIPTTVLENTTFTLEEVTKDQVTPPSGKVFDAFEVNGKRYEVGDKYTVKSDITVKLLWKSTTKGNPKTYDAGILGNYLLLMISIIAGTLSIIYIKKFKRN